MIYIYSTLVIIFFILAGVTRGIFEGIPYYDTFQLYFKSDKWKHFWSRDLFHSNKDRDKNGVTTRMEKWFPNDGGHWIKHGETLSLCLANFFMILVSYNLDIILTSTTLVITALILIILYQLKASIFEVTLTILKNKK